MSFDLLRIRFQSAGMIPPPYTHYYELTARPTGTASLAVSFSITYTDREELDEEDILGEGFTLHDNFTWSGTLGKAWLPLLGDLVKSTRLTPFNEYELGEEDDFLEVTIGTSGAQPTTGTPADADTFLYAVQELIQAVYEAGGKEKPFELSYVSTQRSGDTEVKLQASFAERRLTAITHHNRRDEQRDLPWSQLQPLMREVFAHDLDPALGMAKLPKRDGHFLAIGEGVWHDIGQLTGAQQVLLSLVDR